MSTLGRFGTLCLLFALSSASIARAQTTVTSRILGTITDPQGAAVAGADVRLVDIDTGRDWKTQTGTDGGYVFPDLNAGHYRVEATHEGCRSINRSTAFPIHRTLRSADPSRQSYCD